MANIVDKNAAYMALPMNIKRGNPIPLDTTAVWSDLTELTAYAQSGATAYVGQILTLVASGKCEAYMIADKTGTLTKLAQTTASGDLVSDVAALQTAVKERIKGLTGDGTVIKVTTTTTPDGNDKNAVIAFQLSEQTGNYAEVKPDGLYVPTPTIPTVPVYKIRKETPTSGDFSAVYHLTMDGVDVDVPINIPKDLVVSNGEVKTYNTKELAMEDGLPEPAATVTTFPATFIKLTIANKTSDSLFINVGTLIEYVTAGEDPDGILNITIGDDHKVVVQINDGKITKAKLVKAVQDSLGKADSALQKADITIGATNGTIKVDGTDVKVKGLDSAAYTTVEALNTTAQGYANTAKTEANSYTEGRIGELGNSVGETPHTVKTYVDAQTATINNSISTINTTLAGKANTATTLAGYGIGDAYTKNEIDTKLNDNSTADQNYADGIVDTAKETLIGKSTDKHDADTIYGAKKYAETQAISTYNSMKAYADGLVSDTSAMGKKVKALEDTHAKVGGIGEDKNNFKTVAQEVQAGITALNLDTTYAKKTELPTYDDKSITKNGNKVEIKGFADAADATFPQKNTDGTIHWVPASEMSVATDGNAIKTNDNNKLTLVGFEELTLTNKLGYYPTKQAGTNKLVWQRIPVDDVTLQNDDGGTLKIKGYTEASTKIGAVPRVTTSGMTWDYLWDGKSIEGLGADAHLQLKGFGTATNGQEPRISIDDQGERTLIWVDNKDQAITDINTKFGDYYTKDETYKKSEVNDAINAKVASTYKPAGSIDAEAVSKFVPAKQYLGNVYNVTEQFTTTANFIEGAGKTYPAGTNIVVAKDVSNAYKLDVLAGFVDLTPYAKTTDLTNKVDKVEGKELSSNDFTDTLKTKLEGIATGAQVNYIKSVDTQFTVDTAGKLKLNAIDPSKITGIDAYANKIETVKVGTTALTITDKTVTIPGATASAIGLVKSSAKENGVTVNADFTMTVNSISTDKLVQGQNTIIWNGGNASTT